MASAVDFSIMALFLPTFFFVSVTPGMCMTLAMSLGMSIGLKRTFYMMIGELIGVGIVALSSVVGVAAIMINHPDIFTIFKYAGGLYLGFLGVQLWLNRGKMALFQYRMFCKYLRNLFSTSGLCNSHRKP